DHAVPFDFGQGRGVSGGQRIRGDDQVGISHRGYEGLAAGPFGAVVDVYPQIGYELLHLSLPVTDQRHWTHEQRWSGVRWIRADEGKHRRRLSQAHVVGEDRSEAQSLEEGEPGKAPFLVRPQRPDEPVRRRHGLEAAVNLPREQLSERTVGRDRNNRQAADSLLRG